MNDGNIKKIFCSPNKHASELIAKAISQWPYGYSEHASLIPSDETDDWVIELPEQLADKNLLTIINAYLHVGCGFSYFDNDSTTMLEWQKSGDEFDMLIIKAPRKELAFELWKELSNVVLNHNAANQVEQSTMMTIVGSSMSLDEVIFYRDIIKSLGFNPFINTCFVENTTETNHIVLHISSTQKASNQELNPQFLATPAFLSRQHSD
ncbi:hypothetical protein A9264_05220 [Vibrio sp. UCD-FRSSP16_10]|uniref:hypothetical protein n=1 Tax=unclassified Vibrio TaxID=2614977 RepID=UPI0007FC4A4F|nr:MULTISPECIES: hypothetical protein [unclassified Vibrio]OBT07871.1 hypothetical protein A9260_07460 [Vibrio sp. UCD-FRSSP16_30]OBT17047.1 hypothetical protein A9264_05220 [Vibrio sp. UCD-FRSSP16_10]